RGGRGAGPGAGGGEAALNRSKRPSSFRAAHGAERNGVERSKRPRPGPRKRTLRLAGASLAAYSAPKASLRARLGKTPLALWPVARKNPISRPHSGQYPPGASPPTSTPGRRHEGAFPWAVRPLPTGPAFPHGGEAAPDFSVR